MPDESPLRKRLPFHDLLICAVLVLSTAAAYIHVRECGFLNFDDNIYITANTRLRAGFTPGNLAWVLFSFQPDNWFPVTRLSHLTDYTLFGDNPAPHHEINLAIHIAASLFLFAFLRRATGARWPSAFVAAVFALHPLHVESVAWISERKDVLCAMFWFAALWAWIESAKRESSRFYWLSLSFFALGLMSKPMIVTLPFLLLLLDIWPLRRRPTLRDKIPFFALSAFAALLTWQAQRAGGAIHSLDAYSLSLRLQNALVTPWIYIGKTVWPGSLSAIYSWPAAFPLWQPVAGGLALLLVSILVLRRSVPAFGWFWFLITLAPVIGIVQVGEQARADRYMYVPMVGLAVLLAFSLPRRREFGALACVILTALGLATYRQTAYWTDTETLFRHAVREDSANYSAWLYLGNTLSVIPGVEPDAIAAFQAALRAKPDFPQAHERLATVLFTAGRQPEAIEQYRRALRLKPDYALAHCDLGVALAKLGRTDEAAAQIRQALALNPNYVDAMIDLGVVLASTPGRTSEAIEQFERAVDLEPSNELARRHLATLGVRPLQ